MSADKALILLGSELQGGERSHPQLYPEESTSVQIQ